LNNPYQVKRRYALCRNLYERNINAFNVYRLHEKADCTFPVFIRDEYDHQGALTYLIYNTEDLNRTISQFSEREKLLIVEFVDVSESMWGCFHKYGAFYLDGQIIPRHFFISDDWNVKNSSVNMSSIQKFEQNYIDSNPHQELLKPIFIEAGIEYGRIDYAITDNGIQVFEINTNPTIVDMGDLEKDNPRLFATTEFINQFGKCLLSMTH
jgi:hypothetical protein